MTSAFKKVANDSLGSREQVHGPPPDRPGEAATPTPSAVIRQRRTDGSPQPSTRAIASISIAMSPGNRATSTHTRAGGTAPKNVPYASFMAP